MPCTEAGDSMVRQLVINWWYREFVLLAASSVLTRLAVKLFLNGLLIGDKGEIIMVSHSDSSTTTQSTWNCLNNIPSRAFAWLYGKLVKIATAVKNFLSGGSSSETQPVSIPVVERTISKTSDDHAQHDPYFTVPASFKTTPSVSPEAVAPVPFGTTLPVSPESRPPVPSGKTLPVSPESRPPVPFGTTLPVSPESRPPVSSGTTLAVSPESAPPVSDASREVPPPHRELELYNRAKRRLPYFTGAELQRVCCGDVKSVLSDIVFLFLDLKHLNNSERNRGRSLPDHICELVREKIFNNSTLKSLAVQVRGLDIESWSGKSMVEKINLLQRTNSENIELAERRLEKVEYFHENFEKMLLPLHYNFSAALTSKYQENNPQPAAEQEIRSLQIGVEGIDAVLTEFTEGHIGDQIAQDASLQLRLSGIKEKLQGIIRLLQIR